MPTTSTISSGVSHRCSMPALWKYFRPRSIWYRKYLMCDSVSTWGDSAVNAVVVRIGGGC